MTLGVVVGFEPVDVEHDKRQGGCVAHSSAPFLIEEVIELTPIGNAGQPIQAGESKQHLIRFLQLAHDFEQFLFTCTASVDLMDETQD